MQVENVRKKLRSLKKKFEKFDDFDEKRARRRLEEISKKAVDDAINRLVKVS
jgi:benzoyl-CoA reductase/2-hydroxyglutaryl-CoA dehydratase subunit BcrC/BadD/HgdB